jgi:hypothetical protein
MAILLKIRKSDTDVVLLFGELKIQFKCGGDGEEIDILNRVYREPC